MMIADALRNLCKSHPANDRVMMLMQRRTR
jgi:hypothetical protein